jgi:RND family efflux transporter MFP subunit
MSLSTPPPSSARGSRPDPDSIPSPPGSTPGRRSPGRPRRRSLERLATALFGAAAVVSAGVFGADRLGLVGPGIPGDRPLSSLVRRAPLSITVTERGNMESTKTVDGVCEVQTGQVKIIQLVPEGTRVAKGQLVCRFDSSEIDKNIAQQQIKSEQAASKIETTEQEVEIAKNKGEEEVFTADVEFRLAELTLQKFEESDFKAEIFELQGNIAQQSSKAEEVGEKREQMRELVRKGFRTPEQLRAVDQEYEQYKFMLDSNNQKLEGKKKYEFQLKKTELSSKVAQAAGKKKRAEATSRASVSKAKSEFEAAKSTHTIEKRQLDEYLEQKSKCDIIAAQEGVVAYANEAWYDSSRQIREGAVVWFRQKIFTLPDMSKMQVKVQVHESLVKKVKAGQKAEIRIDAFPNLVLRGTVQSVAQIADSNRSFLSGGAKEYTTVVTIDAMPAEDLRPGMTAEVKILVRTIPATLVVPTQCIVSRKGQHYAYVDTGREIVRRGVTLGDTNERMVEVLSGLKEGERVAQDAKARADAEFKDEAEEAEKEGPTKPATSPGMGPPG